MAFLSRDGFGNGKTIISISCGSRCLSPGNHVLTFLFLIRLLDPIRASVFERVLRQAAFALVKRGAGRWQVRDPADLVGRRMELTRCSVAECGRSLAR